jgi:polyferredoxin
MQARSVTVVRSARIISQIVFFTLFIFFLVVINRNGWVQKYPAEWFLQINPLVALLTSLASRSILYVLLPGAIIVTIATILFGRIFCGFICPLGSAIDCVDLFIFRSMRHSTKRPPIFFHGVKYILLIGLIGLGLAGVLAPFIMDPISLITRLEVLIFDPAARTIGHEGTAFLGFISHLFHSDGNRIAGKSVAMATAGSAGIFVLLLVVFAGGFWDRRFWCQYICPSGAFFALLSRMPLFRRRIVNDKCNYCKTCASHQCPTRAIDADNPKKTSTAECILCGKCAKSARKCTSIGFSRPQHHEIQGPDLTRRHVLAGVLGAVVVLPRVKPSVIISPGNELLRPPGSLPEQAFLSRCIACGECMKVCPQHALHPCGFTEGLSRFGTPKLVPRIGYCDPACNACTHVCPTIALRPVPMEDKPFVKIGTALVDHGRCLAWRDERRCMKCIKACPYQAITEETLTADKDSPSGPAIDKELCTGCGLCEQVCPLTTTPAIRVQSYGERRESAGPFISANRRAKIVRMRQVRLQKTKDEEQEG